MVSGYKPVCLDEFNLTSTKEISLNFQESDTVLPKTERSCCSGLAAFKYRDGCGRRVLLCAAVFKAHPEAANRSFNCIK